MVHDYVDFFQIRILHSCKNSNLKPLLYTCHKSSKCTIFASLKHWRVLFWGQWCRQPHASIEETSPHTLYSILPTKVPHCNALSWTTFDQSLNLAGLTLSACIPGVKPLYTCDQTLSVTYILGVIVLSIC